MEGKNGITIPVLIHAKEDPYEPGNPKTFSVFVLNITQRKMYEYELLQECKNAEEATAELRLVNNDHAQFAYTASHDLQSPLRTISGMIYLLEKKKFIEKGSEEEKLFTLIKSNSNQLRLMIKDLLEYSKGDSDRSAFSLISIEEVCRQSIDLLRDIIKKSGCV